MITRQSLSVERRRRAPEREAKLWHQTVAAHQRLSFLSEASRMLSESLELPKVLSNLAALAVPRIGQWCLIDLVDQAGALEPIALADVKHGRLELLRDLRRRFPPDPASHPILRVVRTGRPEFVTSVGPDCFRAPPGESALPRLLRRLGAGHFVCVPLKANGRAIGALSFGHNAGGRAPSAADMQLGEELGLRVGAAIESSRLYALSRRSDETLTRALSATRMVAWNWDLKTGLIDRSANAREIYGLEPGAELAPGLNLDRIHPADQARYEATVRDAIARCGDYTVRFRMVRHDGLLLSMEDHGSVIRDESGKAARVCGVVMDVTEKKAGEDILSVQAAAARILWSAQTVPEALRGFLKTVCETFDWHAGFVWQAEPDAGALKPIASWRAAEVPRGRLRALKAWSEIRRGADLPGLTWTGGKAVWIGNLEGYANFPRAKAAREAGLRGAFLVPIMGRAGPLGTVEFLSGTSRRPPPKVLELFDGVGKQVGQFLERRQTEDALQRKRAEQQLILDSVNAMIWFKDAENRILRCNRSAADWFGLPTSRVEGRSAYELFPQDADRYHEEDLAVIGSGVPKLGVIEQVDSPKGGRRWLRRDLVPTAGASGRPAGVIILAVDITEIKEAEETLRESERTQKDFVSNVSHEFRTPVAAIKGFTDTLLGGALEDKAHRKRFVRIIRSHADRLAWLVEDVLTLSSLEAGRELKREALDLGRLVAEYLSGIAPLCRKRRVRVLNKVPRGLWADVDRRYLALALENLVTNALRFNTPGGRVWVSAHRLEDHVRLSVRDEGVGIAPEHLRRVFDRFFRVEKGDSKGNIGLGLHLVKKIVEAHGGSIWAESELGKGSAFHMLLPSFPSTARR
ncbi:MAG: PAS domain S-box protein [Elusimicrobia bacterium]|nr:PAS domain S-box protein [Elusimicrobiota bacterium]